MPPIRFAMIEVVHRGVAHEGNREEDHKSDPARLPDEGLQNLENPCPERMAAHPPLDDRVHFVPDVEDEDRSDRFAQAKDDRLHGHVDPRIER